MICWILLLLIVLLFVLVMVYECDVVNDYIIWCKDIVVFEVVDCVQLLVFGVVLFIGSLLICFWIMLVSDFFEVCMINCGFGGLEINDVIYFVDCIVVLYWFSVIVMYVGDNDIVVGDSLGFVLKEFQDFVCKV